MMRCFVLLTAGVCVASARGQTPSTEACPPQKMKVCAVEPKLNTKTVYGSVCKEYCLPRCSLWEMIRGWCGGCSGCGECGPVRTRKVLIKNVSKMHPLLANCLRVTVSTPEENAQFLEAFAASLQD